MKFLYPYTNCKRGTTHFLMPLLVFILLFGIAGTYLVFSSQAATVSGAITSGWSGMCLDDLSNSTATNHAVDIYTCNKTAAQDWQIGNTAGTLRVRGNCLGVQKSANGRVKNGSRAKLYACKKGSSLADSYQLWRVTDGILLINDKSDLCLSTPTTKKPARGTKLVVHACYRAGTKRGQEWHEPVSKLPPPSSGGGGGSGDYVLKPTVVGHELEAGTSGNRLVMHGVTVWGIEDEVTGTFGVNQYNDRQQVINTIKAWGGNEIRLRVLASDFNNQTYMSQQQELQEIKDWQTTAQASGIYLGITWWDSLDGPYNDANWASDYSQAFPMMSAVVNELGSNNPWVFYEPFNEPNNVSDSQWLTAMEATDQLFRSDGYTGILLIDTNDWSHEYNDSLMTDLENYDAGLAGMGGDNQIIFAKHDYANEYPNYTTEFDSSYWADNDAGTNAWNFSQHLIWETEFGNYNGSSGSVSYPWSLGAASWMAAQVNNGNLAGATAFVFGPWYDVNAMTGSDNITPTQWGGYVENDFLGGVE